MPNSRFGCGSPAAARTTASVSGHTAPTLPRLLWELASAPACAGGDSAMHASLEFLVGLLDGDTPRVAQEDFDSAHGPMLRTWQELGFLSREPEMNPVPSCPHCFEGVPYRV